MQEYVKLWMCFSVFIYVYVAKKDRHEMDE